jgi:protein-L-isoaspartate O-methyltransferase
MKLSTLAKLIADGQFPAMLKMLKTCNELYRACFITTALSQGIYGRFVDGRSCLERLCEGMDQEFSREGLRAWLELGVSLGELKRVGNEYQIKGRLSKALIQDKNDGYAALLEEIVKYHYEYVINTPSRLKEQRRFPFDESSGELIARSSRVSEPLILEAVDAVVPRKGDFHLLEVGCGSGVYVHRACERNPDLRAVGLELQQTVADFARKNIASWGLEDRVSIEHCDVRDYQGSQEFDLITLHQNIYYFPVADRVVLARHLIDLLKPGGKVLLTTIGQGGNPSTQVLNIWVSTTEGYGPLPDPDELCRQFREAGFAEVKSKRLIPFESFWSFVAAKPR